MKKIAAVKDLMSREVIYARSEDLVVKAIGLLRENMISGMPVLDEKNRVVGVFSGTDAIKLLGDLKENKPFLIPFFELLENRPGDLEKIYSLAGERTVGEVMSKPPVTIEENKNAEEAAGLMWKKDINRLPVVDSEGKLTGVITRKDILELFK